MEIYLQKNGNFTQPGSALLNDIQNVTLRRVDLLVRECFQNSLDAAKDDTGEVRVEIMTGQFRHEPFDAELEGITRVLKEKFQKPMAEFLAIRDSNTVGLTGPLSSADIQGDDHGNLRKLVYEIGQPQTKQGSGGSWGIGKTVCFGFGIGLVMYYTRIHEESGYQSRLAVTLVENEKDPDTLLRKANLQSGAVPCGTAWWGKADHPDTADENSVPVTDENKIREILSYFGLSPYSGDETGTTVIIPFIDREALETEACLRDAPAPGRIRQAGSGLDLEWYLSQAVYRWFSPRMRNVRYQKLIGPRLIYLLNGKAKKASEMRFFYHVQELYNAALSEKAGDVIPEGFYVDPIEIRSRGGKKALQSSLAGWLAYKTYTKGELGMGLGDFIPYELIEKSVDTDKGNPVILCFCRNAGIIIRYALGGESKWLNNVPSLSADKYLLAFFVPNGWNKLADSSVTLDDYLRRLEAADHADWDEDPQTDPVTKKKNPYVILEKLQKGVTKKISETISPEEQPTVTDDDASGLQRELGSLFLAGLGCGKKSSKRNKIGGNRGSGGVPRGHGKHISIAEMHMDYAQEMASLRLDVPYPVKEIVISLEVRAPGTRRAQKGRGHDGQMSAEMWESSAGMGTRFPLSFSRPCAFDDEGNALSCKLRKSSLGADSELVIDTSGVSGSRQNPVWLGVQTTINSEDESLVSILQITEGGKEADES